MVIHDDVKLVFASSHLTMGFTDTKLGRCTFADPTAKHTHLPFVSIDAGISAQ